MNAVGIDVSKGTSTVAVIRPFGEIVRKPFDVMHTSKEPNELADFILSLDGESRVVMEHTGRYSDPIAKALGDAGVFVCMVNAKLIHDYGGDTIRRVRTDKVSALKIAGFCLDKWAKLTRLVPADDSLSEYVKVKTMLKNNLISLCDQVFPGVNRLFTSQARDGDGHEKWIDFLACFWHSECVSCTSLRVFAERYRKWCKRGGYNFSASKAEIVHSTSKELFTTLPRSDFTKTLVLQAVSLLNSLCETIAALKTEMTKIAKTLPEYDTVISMHGVGKTLAPQLIAEIGDIRRYPKRSSLARFAGIKTSRKPIGRIQSTLPPHFKARFATFAKSSVSSYGLCLEVGPRP